MGMSLGLLAYGDRISAAPGDTIRFMVSADGVARYRAEIVRLVHGDANPAGPGFKAIRLPSTVDGDYDGRFQSTAAGSYVAVPDLASLAGGSFSLAAMVWPTRPGKGRQAILAKGDARRGFVLGLDEGGRLALSLGN